MISDKGSVEVLRIGKGAVDIVECAHKLSTSTEVLTDATGGVLVIQEEIHVVICGGQEVSSTEDNVKCISLSDPITKWSDLISARIGAASLPIDNGQALWVTGGFNSDNSLMMLVTELVAKESNQQGPLLPLQPVKHHCLEKISASRAILVGGENHYIGVEQTTWFYDLNRTAEVTFGPLLSYARSRHVCGVLKDKMQPDSSSMRIVIAAGGMTNDNVLTDSVEILIIEDKDSDIESSVWQRSAEQMPIKVANAASATTSDQLRMFVVGGTTTNDPAEEALTSIFSLECHDGTCNQWTRLDLDLETPAKGLAFIIPTIPMEGRLADTDSLLSDTESSEGAKSLNYSASAGIEYILFI